MFVSQKKPFLITGTYLRNRHPKDQSMAFLAPIVRYSPRPIPARTLTQLQLSPHPGYDVAAVSTYVAYFLSQYWAGEERRDVEFFAVVMTLFWNFTHDHDAVIFLYLWLIGGTSEFISKSFLAGGNKVEYERFRVGTRLGGYMSFLLLITDLFGLLLEN